MEFEKKGCGWAIKNLHEIFRVAPDTGSVKDLGDRALGYRKPFPAFLSG